MQDVRSMDARELGRGLMRGNSAELKQGYSWENATKAALELRGIDPQSGEALELALYLRGFADGMAGRYDTPLQAAYLEGARMGSSEPAELIMPAQLRRERGPASELERSAEAARAEAEGGESNA